ncbi:MAG: LysM peptidoglycan-binding domain-containing protein [Firmicutes bacterium]|nr:LysM peptidoglycan-binding domain-containing protein [Bacillota bacterium]
MHTRSSLVTFLVGFAASVTVLSLSAATAAFAATDSYTVVPGDTLWAISQREGVGLAELEAANPSASFTDLLVGTRLVIPAVVPATNATYTVLPGDTEWLIAQRLHVSWAALQAANSGVNPTDLQPGQVLQVPTTPTTLAMSTSTGTSSTTITASSTSGLSGDSPSAAAPGSGTDTQASAPVPTSDQNLYWMERVIAAEASGQPMDAKLGVGAVVWNRMHSPYYASTVQEVVFQSIAGHAQFTSVSNGWIYQVQPTASDLTAAQEVLSGTDILPTAFVFYNPAQTPSSSWVYTQAVVGRYGNLTFAS